MTGENLQEIADQLGQTLIQRMQMLALAESCTGGWLGQVVTAVAGSSAWFDRGFVTYSNLAKSEMLGVAPQLIRDEGAVSRAVVQSMAEGAIANSAAQWSIAVSGVAGPDGGSDSRPVGTVWIAWAGVGRRIESRRFQFSGGREAVRRATVQAGLEGLLQYIE